MTTLTRDTSPSPNTNLENRNQQTSWILFNQKGLCNGNGGNFFSSQVKPDPIPMQNPTRIIEANTKSGIKTMGTCLSKHVSIVNLRYGKPIFMGDKNSRVQHPLWFKKERRNRV